MNAMNVSSKQLENIAWGLGLLWVGTLSLIPGDQNSLGLTGVGLILLGVNLLRSMNGIPINRFSTLLGGIALVLGLVVILTPYLNIPAFNVDLFSILLIVFGLYFLLPDRKKAVTE